MLIPTISEAKAAKLAEKNDAWENIARIRQRLADLNDERMVLERELEAFEQQLISDSQADAEKPVLADAPVTNSSPSMEKVELFRQLFAGRPDVFPVRWNNKKDGRSGYSPACSNEWAKGICGKPKVKCGDCPHQAFIPYSEDIIERHLRGGDARSGDFVAGVYPLLQDETCWFLAADFDKESWVDDPELCWPLVVQKEFPLPSNGRGRETVAMSGYSSPNPFRPGSPVNWVPR
jgi:hypothetical protein